MLVSAKALFTYDLFLEPEIFTSFKRDSFFVCVYLRIRGRRGFLLPNFSNVTSFNYNYCDGLSSLNKRDESVSDLFGDYFLALARSREIFLTSEFFTCLLKQRGGDLGAVFEKASN